MKVVIAKKPRCVRGGAWNNNARRARSANRNANTPGNADNNLGFRFCLSSMSTALRSQRHHGPDLSSRSIGAFPDRQTARRPECG